MFWLYTGAIVANGELVQLSVVADYGFTGDFNERGIRGVGYDIVNAANSISAISSQLPCFGV